MPDWEMLISKKIGKALFAYHMLEENDRILVAVSGGKDSMTLLYHLLEKQNKLPIRFSVGAVHIQSDFCACGKKSGMYDVLDSWGVDWETLKVPVIAPCFLIAELI